MKKFLLTLVVALGLASSASAITAWDLDGKVMTVRFAGNNAQLGAPVETRACPIVATSNTSFVLKDFLYHGIEIGNNFETVSYDMPCTINTSTNAITLKYGNLTSNEGYSIAFGSHTCNVYATGYSLSGNGQYTTSAGYYGCLMEKDWDSSMFSSAMSYITINTGLTNKQWAFIDSNGKKAFSVQYQGCYPSFYGNIILTLVEPNAIAIELDSDGKVVDSYKMRIDKSGTTLTFQNIFNLGSNYNYQTYYVSNNRYTLTNTFSTTTKANSATVNSSSTTSTLSSEWTTGTVSNNNVTIPSRVVQVDIEYGLDDDEGLIVGSENWLINRKDLARYPYSITGAHSGSNLTSITGTYTTGSKKHITTVNWDEKSGGNLKTYEYNNSYNLNEAYLYFTSPWTANQIAQGFPASDDIAQVGKTVIMMNPVDVTADIDLVINKFGSDRNHGVFVNATVKPNNNLQHIDHLELMMVPGKFSSCTANGFTHCPNNGHTLGQSLHNDEYDVDIEASYHPLALTADNSYTVAKLIPYDQIENPSADPADYSFFVKAVYADGLEHTFHALTTPAITTSVEDLQIKDFAPECEKAYYTLDGRLVKGEPTPGVYVCKQGGVATKVIIK